MGTSRITEGQSNGRPVLSSCADCRKEPFGSTAERAGLAWIDTETRGDRCGNATVYVAVVGEAVQGRQRNIAVVDTAPSYTTT